MHSVGIGVPCRSSVGCVHSPCSLLPGYQTDALHTFGAAGHYMIAMVPLGLLRRHHFQRSVRSYRLYPSRHLCRKLTVTRTSMSPVDIPGVTALRFSDHEGVQAQDSNQ